VANNDLSLFPPEEDIQLNPVSLKNFAHPAEEQKAEEP